MAQSAPRDRIPLHDIEDNFYNSLDALDKQAYTLYATNLRKVPFYRRRDQAERVMRIWNNPKNVNQENWRNEARRRNGESVGSASMSESDSSSLGGGGGGGGGDSPGGGQGPRRGGSAGTQQGPGRGGAHQGYGRGGATGGGQGPGGRGPARDQQEPERSAGGGTRGGGRAFIDRDASTSSESDPPSPITTRRADVHVTIPLTQGDMGHIRSTLESNEWTHSHVIYQRDVRQLADGGFVAERSVSLLLRLNSENEVTDRIVVKQTDITGKPHHAHLANHEVGLLGKVREIRCRNILDCRGASSRIKHMGGVIQRDVMFTYLEYAAGGDLQSMITRHFRLGLCLSEHFLWFAFKCLVEAISALRGGRCSEGHGGPRAGQHGHWNPITHLDIKPWNIFVGDADNFYAAYPVLMLGDFDLAFEIDSTFPLDNMKAVWAQNRGCGTAGYMAPEQTDVRSENPLDERTDLFGIGMVMWQLLHCGLNPSLSNEARRYGHGLEATKPKLDLESIPLYSNRIIATIQRCMDWDRTLRPDLDELKRDIDDALEELDEEDEVYGSLKRERDVENVPERLRVYPEKDVYELGNREPPRKRRKTAYDFRYHSDPGLIQRVHAGLGEMPQVDTPKFRARLFVVTNDACVYNNLPEEDPDAGIFDYLVQCIRHSLNDANLRPRIPGAEQYARGEFKAKWSALTGLFVAMWRVFHARLSEHHNGGTRRTRRDAQNLCKAAVFATCQLNIGIHFIQLRMRRRSDWLPNHRRRSRFLQVILTFIGDTRPPDDWRTEYWDNRPPGDPPPPPPPPPSPTPPPPPPAFLDTRALFQLMGQLIPVEPRFVSLRRAGSSSLEIMQGVLTVLRDHANGILTEQNPQLSITDGEKRREALYFTRMAVDNILRNPELLSEIHHNVDEARGALLELQRALNAAWNAFGGGPESSYAFQAVERYMVNQNQLERVGTGNIFKDLVDVWKLLMVLVESVETLHTDEAIVARAQTEERFNLRTHEQRQALDSIVDAALAIVRDPNLFVLRDRAVHDWVIERLRLAILVADVVWPRYRSPPAVDIHLGSEVLLDSRNLGQVPPASIRRPSRGAGLDPPGPSRAPLEDQRLAAQLQEEEYRRGSHVHDPLLPRRRPGQQPMTNEEMAEVQRGIQAGEHLRERLDEVEAIQENEFVEEGELDFDVEE